MYIPEEFSRLDAFLKEQSAVLQMVTRGGSLPAALRRLLAWTEMETTNGVMTAVFGTGSHDTQLHFVAGHRLPERFTKAINGARFVTPSIAGDNESGGASPPVCTSIAENPFFKSYAPVAGGCGIRSCWSIPLVTDTGEVKGMLAGFYSAGSVPSESDWQLAKLAAHTALLAIECAGIAVPEKRASLGEKAGLPDISQHHQRFQNFVRDASISIIVLRGEEWLVEMVNEAYSRLLNRTPGQLLNKPLFSVVNPEDVPFKQLAEEVLLQGCPVQKYHQPYTIKGDGPEETVYLNVIGQPYRELDGKTSGVMVLCHNVTEIVRARQALEKREAEFRSLVMQAPVAIAIFKGEELVADLANDYYLRLVGRSMEEVIGKPLPEALPELKVEITAITGELFRTGNTFVAEEYELLTDRQGRKERAYISTVAKPFFDVNGKVDGFITVAHEITAFVVGRRKIVESEERARLAIEASEQGTFHINLLTNELECSPRMQEIFDVDGSSDRQRFVAAIHPDDLKIRDAAYKRAYETSILDYEARLIRKNGFIAWIRVKGKVYFNSGGDPVRLVGVAQDITEQKEFAEALSEKVIERTAELEEANRQLITINDELQQFAYVSSHDLQEPLRKIRIFSDLLAQYISPGGEAAKYLSKIASSAERMTGLIQSLLDYSRVSNSQGRFEAVDLNALLKVILTDYELLIAQKNATLIIEKLPVVDGLPLQLNQLFFNLLGNALKFTRRGVQPVIRISAEPLCKDHLPELASLGSEKNYAVITVQDNGIGFDQSFASKIFTVFQRLNERSQFGGYGIGLALCKKVVQTHGGFIFAKGQPKQGATFTVVLPMPS